MLRHAINIKRRQCRKTESPITMAFVLVTGANGFVGQVLCKQLKLSGREVKQVVRNATSPQQIPIGNMNGTTDWQPALEGCDTVIHLAARVHIMNDTATEPLTEFRQVNTEGTLNLARQAALYGIKRFVFISSLKVNGESGMFSETSKPEPEDAYAISKWEAECGLHDIAYETGMEVVVLRPPLVYGPGVGANFMRLLNAIHKGIPLPFGSMKNSRSLIYLDNLVSAILACASHPAAAGKTYLVSDNHDVSTVELITQLAKALGRAPRLIRIPPKFIEWLGAFIGKRKEFDRLLGSLTIDGKAITRDLGWTPPFTMQEGLVATIAWYRQRHPQ
ncbi:MAG TPA: SDR family oxidoreductase [Methylophilaceae bacterium]|jgi:nucleoside-diphosphate-sugar epimerase|nr:SDR family oxidoreductase [Methylophilaceae bacterium]